MTATDIASANLWWPNAIPSRCISATSSTASQSFDFLGAAAAAGTTLVMGMDVVASGAEPVQCFCALQLPRGVTVFYDSQSTGEGLGVRFTWRGQIPIGGTDEGSVVVRSSGTIPWAVTVWGITIPGLYTVGTVEP